MKKLLTSVMSLMLLLTIGGCGSKKSSNEEKTELIISAAASMKESMAEIEPLFTKEFPNIKLTFNFGASGSLQQQIEQGAPADVFISAGQKQMTNLVDKGLIETDTNKNLVTNKLVLVGPKDTSLTDVSNLTDSSINKIAVGEPSSVPAGKYADEVLRNAKLYDAVSSKLVFAKDVKEVLAWTASGNAEVGFVYLSDAKASDSVKIIETIPDDLHSPIVYPMAIIKSSSHKDEAKKFTEFLYSQDAKAVFEKYGYSIAE